MGGRVFPHVGVLVSHYFCVAGDDVDVDGFGSGLAWDCGMCYCFFKCCCKMMNGG